MLNFHPVELRDQETVDSYMSRFGGNSCQHSFVTLFTLSEKYDSRICEQDGFLYIFRSGLSEDGKRVYLAPMGAGDLKEAYRTVLHDAASHGCRAVFQTVTANQVEFLKSAFPGKFQYTELRDYAEYIYLSSSLSAMKGGRFVSKRNAINRILRTYGDRLEVKSLLPEHIPAILRFEEKWLRDNISTHDAAALELEANAMRKQLAHFEALKLTGIGVFLDGEMVAFYYGTALSGSCYDGLVEKARRDIPHLYKLVCWKAACICAAPYTYFNWEEDVGVAGLRNMKMQLGPAVLLRKYLVEEPEIPGVVPDSDGIPLVSDTDLYPGEELISGSFPSNRC